jgi:hypothetical protein
MLGSDLFSGGVITYGTLSDNIRSISEIRDSTRDNAKRPRKFIFAKELNNISTLDFKTFNPRDLDELFYFNELINTGFKNRTFKMFTVTSKRKNKETNNYRVFKICNHVFLKIEVTVNRYLYEVYTSKSKDGTTALFNKGSFRSETATIVALKRLIREYQ